MLIYQKCIRNNKHNFFQVHFHVCHFRTLKERLQSVPYLPRSYLIGLDKVYRLSCPFIVYKDLPQVINMSLHLLSENGNFLLYKLLYIKLIHVTTLLHIYDSVLMFTKSREGNILWIRSFQQIF